MGHIAVAGTAVNIQPLFLKPEVNRQPLARFRPSVSFIPACAPGYGQVVFDVYFLLCTALSSDLDRCVTYLQQVNEEGSSC
jgi:hypothetical protein